MPMNSSGAPDDNYPVADNDDDAAPQAQGEEDQAPEGETALLPTSILAGKTFNVGDEVVLKIVHMGDGEIEVAYAKGDDKGDQAKPGPKDGEKPEMAGADSDMMAMMAGQK